MENRRGFSVDKIILGAVDDTLIPLPLRQAVFFRQTGARTGFAAETWLEGGKPG